MKIVSSKVFSQHHNTLKNGVEEAMGIFVNAVHLCGDLDESQCREYGRILKERKIPYFHDFKSSDPDACSPHLVNGKVIVFFVSDEFESYDSLAKIGWIARSAMVNDQRLILVVPDIACDFYHVPNDVRQLVRANACEAGILCFNHFGEEVIEEIIYNLRF